VTIFGESAGAVSVSSHIASPLSKGLFSKGISESGLFSASSGRRLMQNTSVEGAMKIAQAYAERLGCTGKNQLACLRGKER